jgi:tRNA A22 N-methylase
MGEFYSDLAQALRDRLQVIGDKTLQNNPSAHLEKLQQASERIDALKAKLPANTDARLVHYLDRMSLSKALEFIETECLAKG